ncbi:hypothetical protein B7494_g5724 [Chlorociboria aeruginascens]|nr:hypothetical protein B7494_g5724 [Chlorociboria aeruginascens]
MSTPSMNSARRAPIHSISQGTPAKMPLTNSPYLTGSIPDLLKAQKPKFAQERYMKEIGAMTQEQRENIDMLAYRSPVSPDGFMTAPSAGMSLQKRYDVNGGCGCEGEEGGKEKAREDGDRDGDKDPEFLELEPELETEDKEENRDGYSSPDRDEDDEEGYVVINHNEEVPAWEHKTEGKQDSLMEDLRPLMRRFSRGVDMVYCNGMVVSKHGFDLLPEPIRTRILDSRILGSFYKVPGLNWSGREDSTTE